MAFKDEKDTTYETMPEPVPATDPVPPDPATATTRETLDPITHSALLDTLKKAYDDSVILTASLAQAISRL